MLSGSAEEVDVTQTSWVEWIAGDQLWKAVIRPPRDAYSEEELGPVNFKLGVRVYRRTYLRLVNTQGQFLECSHFQPARRSSSSAAASYPCAVYLHGNASSRLEALGVLPVLLPLGVTVFCLDLSGSGRSEGRYVSLGHQEEKDLCVALRYLRKSGTVSNIGLWGRSMGAATAILRAAKDHCLKACVLDSPFTDLRTVARELAGQRLTLTPQFIVDMGLEAVRNEVKIRAGFDPDEVMPVAHAPKARCPALFGAATEDKLTLPHHAEELNEAWGGESKLLHFQGDHNSDRPGWFTEAAAEFLAEHLRPKEPELRTVPLQRSRSSTKRAISKSKARSLQQKLAESEKAITAMAESLLGMLDAPREQRNSLPAKLEQSKPDATG